MAKAEIDKKKKIASIIRRKRVQNGKTAIPSRNEKENLPKKTRDSSKVGNYNEDDVVRNADDGRWAKGQSGNPGGRPVGRLSMTAKLKQLLNEDSVEVAGLDKADELIQIAYQAARRGDFRFFQEIFNRVDGKVADKTILQEDAIKLYDKDAPIDEV